MCHLWIYQSIIHHYVSSNVKWLNYGSINKPTADTDLRPTCRFVRNGKRRQSVSIRLSASRLYRSSFLWKVLSMSMVIVTLTVRNRWEFRIFKKKILQWDNIVSLITNRWSDRPRLVIWWTIALRRRYELRHANQLCQNFVAEGRPW